MKSQNKYIIYREDVNTYVLQKDFPHYTGRITNKLERSISQYPIAGYHLYVSYSGTIRGNYAITDKFALQEIEMIFSDMANFALDNLIKSSEDYEKYKIRNTSK